MTSNKTAAWAGAGEVRAHGLFIDGREVPASRPDLLDVLNITKQSLSRVLKQLIDKGYILQKAGASDRRERLLYPTEKGRTLAGRLAAPQLVRLAAAIQAAGPGGETAIRRFLEAMVNAEERPKVSAIMSSSPAPVEDDGKAEVS